jgi:hypothetical protein
MDVKAIGLRERPAPAGTSLRDLGIERRAWFDLNGDGRIENTSSLTGGDAYLIGDRDGDGRISTGRETWYDRNGRTVAHEHGAARPAAPPSTNRERALEVAAHAYTHDG